MPGLTAWPGSWGGGSAVKQWGARLFIIGAVVVSPAMVAERVAAQQPAPITIDYPEDESIFPPEITAPTFLWRDAAENATVWRINVTFGDGSAGIHRKSLGERMRIGEIDPRCISNTNEMPKLTPRQAAARTWTPDVETWETIKRHSAEHPATVTITGLRDTNVEQAISRGRITIHTSKDPVGAPIFYRDVPLMPSELERGVIKPLAPNAVPLVAWRLRYLGESRSRVIMQGLPTCANCHSFSRDGKTMGMDVDGPENDKGTYAIVPVTPQTSIRTENVITWNSFPDKPAGQRTIGFLAQISPDGQYAVVTLNEQVYVANFKDYHFLQVFYPTRGILAWHNRRTGQVKALPGADDPRYVQTDGVWSPDGKYLVFARAEAKDSYPEGQKIAEFANDPNEPPMRYDLYRIPFNSGRGGQPKPIAGASRNGMSNTFPKVSPDGRWIVFVQCRNGQLMRPDSQLYIVPAQGGQARRMRCNTSLMNSWHSFSPNGRWLVFSSKSRSPYTQMYLTHLDEAGNDSPPILIDGATAANRAVNIPEFVNIPPDGLSQIDMPAAEFYRIFDLALELAEKGQDDAAIAEWKKALAIDPDNARAYNNLGVVLIRKGSLDEAMTLFRRAIQLQPGYTQAHFNLGGVLFQKGRSDETISEWQKTAELNPDLAEVRNLLGMALAREGKFDEAIAHWQKAAELDPRYAEAHNNLAGALVRKGRFDEGIVHLQKALEVDPEYPQAHHNLGVALARKRDFGGAIAHWRRALELKPDYSEAHYSLGRTLYLLGRFPEALAHWHASLRIEPDNVSVANQTAWVLATCPEASVRNGPEAVRLAQRAIQLSGGREPMVLDTMAAAYAEVGRFPEAVETANRALALATQQNNQRLANALSARIGLYESRTPFRETQQPSPSPPQP